MNTTIDKGTASAAASTAANTTAATAAAAASKKTPLILKILAILLIVSAVFGVPVMALFIVDVITTGNPFGGEVGIMTLVLSIVSLVVSLVCTVVGALFGLFLLRNKRRNARRFLEILIGCIAVAMLCEIMIDGISAALLYTIIRLVIFVVVATYIDPALSEERRVQRKLRSMETREKAEKGTLGRDLSGKGFLKLDFFNIFWIFVVGCVFGLLVETCYCLIINHVLEDRAGVLYGPFSPIYGFGAIIMTAALNRLYDNALILVFVFSAVIGGTFEFLVSWFMEFAFGIIAWDYSGTFLSIEGRTNAMFMVFWGVLGCLWVKLLFPYLLKLVNLIPWSFRYTATTICAALMIANGVLTLAAFDSWFQRQASIPPNNAIEEFCNNYYDDDFMEARFQTMSIDPTTATRG